MDITRRGSIHSHSQIESNKNSSEGDPQMIGNINRLELYAVYGTQQRKLPWRTQKTKINKIIQCKVSAHRN